MVDFMNCGINALFYKRYCFSGHPDVLIRYNSCERIAREIPASIPDTGSC